MLSHQRGCAAIAISIASVWSIGFCRAAQDDSAELSSPPPIKSFDSNSNPLNAAVPSSWNGEGTRTTLGPLQPAENFSKAPDRPVESKPSAPPRSPNSIWLRDNAPRFDAAVSASEPQVDPYIQKAAHIDADTNPSAPGIARRILDSLCGEPRDATLPGKPTSLATALAMAPIENRPGLIRAYWDAFERWGELVAVRAEQSQLADLHQPVNSLERELLNTASSLARARALQCEIDMEAAQMMLARFSPADNSDLLPLPIDLPLVDEYVTHFGTIGQGSMNYPRLAHIDRVLPKKLAVIQAQADAASRCGSAARQAIQSFNQNQVSLGNALEAIRMSRESRLEFLANVNGYNQQIAEYALSVAPFGQSVEQVVAMLIKSPNPAAPGEPTLVDIEGSIRPLRSPMGATAAERVNPPAMSRLAQVVPSSSGANSGQQYPEYDDNSVSVYGSAAALGDESPIQQSGGAEVGGGALKSRLGSSPPPQSPQAMPARDPASITSGGGSFSLGNR